MFEDLQSFVRRTEPKGLGLDADSMPDVALQRVWVALDGRRGVVTQDHFGWLMKLVRVEEAGSTAGTGKAAEGVRAEECAEGDSVEKKEDVAEEDKGEKASGVVAPVGGADGEREGSAETEAGERADTEGRAKGAVTVGAEEKVEEAENGEEKADAKIEKQEGKSAEEEAEEMAIEKADSTTEDKEEERVAETEGDGAAKTSEEATRAQEGEKVVETTIEKKLEKAAENTEEAGEKVGEEAADETNKPTKMGAKAVEDKVTEDAGATR